MRAAEFLNDKELVGGAYELSVLLQYGCEHYGLKPTVDSMRAIHDGMADEAPLDRAAALEYAALLIMGAAGELVDGGDVEPEAVEAALEAWEAE